MNPSGVVVVSKGMQRLLRWIVFSCALNAVVFLLALDNDGPSNAYSAVFHALPFWVVWSGWVATGVVAALVVSDLLNPSVRYFVLGGYSLLQAVFAWSILWLAFDGVETALVGASQWAGYVYFSVMALLDRPHEPRKLVD